MISLRHSYVICDKPIPKFQSSDHLLLIIVYHRLSISKLFTYFLGSPELLHFVLTFAYLVLEHGIFTKSKLSDVDCLGSRPRTHLHLFSLDLALLIALKINGH